MARDTRRRRDLHFLNFEGMVACNPRDREAAHRAQMEGIATENADAVTCRKCRAAIRRAGERATPDSKCGSAAPEQPPAAGTRLHRFEAWQDPRDRSILLALPQQVSEHRAHGLLSQKAKLLYTIDAASFEEAMAIHHLRQGGEPYHPGRAALCPRGCGAYYYPDGSGECPLCGEV
jgi:hypothetical protein